MVSTRETRHRVKRQLKKLGRKADVLAHRLADGVSEGYERLADRRVCLGVTGFSGSGKSTFISSFIYQLENYPNASLPAFSPALQQRILGVSLSDHYHGDIDGIAAYPYAENKQRLQAQPPQWPASTDRLSRAILELRLTPRKRLVKLPGRSYESVHIELNDYPGEWLLDLPLLSMSFEQWCGDCASLFAQSPRRELLGDDYRRLLDINADDRADESVLNDLHGRFVKFLQQAKASEKRLSLLQPGRYVLPGSVDVNDLPQFFPLLNLNKLDADALTALPVDSVYKTLKREYERYVSSIVKPFYRDHFSRLDRQVILVDVLQALNAGELYLEDMRVAMTRVLESFSYGHATLLNRLFNPKIDRVVIVASKIDQVLPEQHENVRALIAALVNEAYRKVRFEQVDVHCEAVASIRASTVTEHKGRAMLQGTIAGEQAALLSHPDIPDHLPRSDEWQAFKPWQLRALMPPKQLPINEGGSLPHIRLDVVIRELLGDKC